MSMLGVGEILWLKLHLFVSLFLVLCWPDAKRMVSALLPSVKPYRQRSRSKTPRMSNTTVPMNR